MRREDVNRIGVALSKARSAARPGSIDLRVVDSIEQAQKVQAAANTSYNGIFRGYTLAATSALTARVLNCFHPVVGTLLDEHILDTGTRFRLPHSMLGVGAQFIFVIGSPLYKPTSLQAVRNAIVSCHLGMQLLGRRVLNSVPLNDWSATADFGLEVGCVRGPPIEDWDDSELSSMEASLQLNRNVVAKGRGADVLGGPICAILYLARVLSDRGVALEAGDMVATGSCTGLAQVVPGQRVRAAFGRLGDVELSLE